MLAAVGGGDATAAAAAVMSTSPFYPAVQEHTRAQRLQPQNAEIAVRLLDALPSVGQAASLANSGYICPSLAATLEGTTWLASSSAAPAGGKKRGTDGDALRAGRASREPLGDVSWRERRALG